MAIKYKEGKIEIEFEDVAQLLIYTGKEAIGVKEVVIEAPKMLPEHIENVTEQKPKFKRRPALTKAKKTEIFQKVHEQMKGGAQTHCSAFRTIIGHGGGAWQKEYRRWAKKQANAPEGKHHKYMLRNKAWIEFRAKHLKAVMKANNLTVGQATKYLATEYKNTQDKQVNMAFPTFDSVESHLRPIFRDMLERLTKDNSLSLSYKIEGEILGIQSAAHWNNLLAELMLRHKDVLRHFQVKGKFIVTEDKKVMYR
jgi:competence CoiA-like predicted nuclease